MARPTKQGLDYFPLDVGFLQDVKIRRIMRACGIQSIPILISLLANIYRDDGYFLKWDNDMPFLIADELGVSEGAVCDTVNKAVQIDFFNADMFEQYKILTSIAIQKRFFSATYRRKEVFYDGRFILLNSSDYKNLVNVYKNPVNVYGNEQSKVKKSKEKNINNSSGDEAGSAERSDTKEIIKFFQDNFHLDISSFESETLLSLLAEFKKDVLLDAMQIAVKSNVRNLRYVEGILRRKKSNPYGGDEYAASRSRGRGVQKKDSTATRKNKVLTDWSQVSDNWDDYV